MNTLYKNDISAMAKTIQFCMNIVVCIEGFSLSTEEGEQWINIQQYLSSFGQPLDNIRKLDTTLTTAY